MADIYENTKRLGDRVTFDGTDVFAAYNADLISMVPLAGPVSASYAKKAGMHKYRLYRSDIPLKTLELQFYVGGETEEEAELNVSRLLSAAKACTIINSAAPSFAYDVLLTGYTDTDSGVGAYHQVGLKFAAIKHSAQSKSQTLRTGSNTIQYDGTAEGGYELTLIFSTGGTNVAVPGGRLNLVQSGDTWLMDGLEGKVSVNGRNGLGDCTITRFPKLQPGSNTIQIPSGVSMAYVTYYEVYT